MDGFRTGGRNRGGGGEGVLKKRGDFQVDENDFAVETG
jgi:hypothetical protein